jgi:hypothetical protein
MSTPTQTEVERSAAVAEAARWLTTTPREQRGHAVPELQKRFGLSAVEACAAIREANLRRARAA